MLMHLELGKSSWLWRKKKKNKSGKKDTCEIGLESERKGKRGKRELLMVMREGGIQRWMVSWGSWT
jgi:hypothetical protein